MSPTAWDVAAGVPDPELPAVTIADLGILREVIDTGDGVVVTVTPTYSGCPAMPEIRGELVRRLGRAGYADVEVRARLAPAWTTDWITAAGRAKLGAAGIAPPTARSPVTLTLGRRPDPPCPRCGSCATRVTAAFGSAACRSLHRCLDCDEPFEAVKPL